MNLLLYGLAFLLDLIFKDIELWPHPVRFIGVVLNHCEKYSRNQTIISLKLAGAISLLISCALVGLIVYFFISLKTIGIVFKVYFAYSGLALGGLLEKAKEVLNLCEVCDLENARIKLSYLVSRDTCNMNKKEILRSLAETISENFNDGYVAPFFYLIVGGPILLWIYKTISTMDSMWGYKTDRWRELGWAGAKMDDIFGYIPARISFFLIFSWHILKTRDLSVIKNIKNAIWDAKKMESPNAGWSMAACAWVCGCIMGGDTIYFGNKYHKPILGKGTNWDIKQITYLLKFILECGVYTCILFLLIRYML